MIQILFLQTIFLQSVDAFLTYGSLSQNIASETNPIISPIINNGWQYFFLFKIIGIIFLYIILYDIKSKNIKLSTLISINLVYILIFAYNLSQISRVM